MPELCQGLLHGGLKYTIRHLLAREPKFHLGSGRYHALGVKITTIDKLGKRLEVASALHVDVDDSRQPIVAIDVASVEFANEVSPVGRDCL